MNTKEVNAMTDEELKIKAAELLGWTECGPSGPYVNVPTGIPPEEWLASKDEMAVCRLAVYGNILVIPDYLNDISAAWGLFEKIPLPALISRGYEDAWKVGPLGYGVELGECIDDEPEFFLWSISAPAAITKAFIIAMSDNELDK